MTRRCLMAVCFWSLALAGGDLAAQVSREYDIKAVFLLNFVQFVEWPTDAFAGPGDPLVIGILGNDPFRSSLDQVVRDEKVRDRKVVVQRFRRIEELGACHILFISLSEARRLPQIQSALKERPILTVSEIEGFAQRGGMIQMDTENDKVRLRINPEYARGARLTVSSKLLRVAEVVTNPPGN